MMILSMTLLFLLLILFMIFHIDGYIWKKSLLRFKDNSPRLSQLYISNKQLKQMLKEAKQKHSEKNHAKVTLSPTLAVYNQSSKFNNITDMIITNSSNELFDKTKFLKENLNLFDKRSREMNSHFLVNELKDMNCTKEFYHLSASQSNKELFHKITYFYASHNLLSIESIKETISDVQTKNKNFKELRLILPNIISSYIQYYGIVYSDHLNISSRINYAEYISNGRIYELLTELKPLLISGDNIVIPLGVFDSLYSYLSNGFNQNRTKQICSFIVDEILSKQSYYPNCTSIKSHPDIKKLESYLYYTFQLKRFVDLYLKNYVGFSAEENFDFDYVSFIDLVVMNDYDSYYLKSMLLYCYNHYRSYLYFRNRSPKSISSARNPSFPDSQDINSKLCVQYLEIFITQLINSPRTNNAYPLSSQLVHHILTFYRLHFDPISFSLFLSYLNNNQELKYLTMKTYLLTSGFFDGAIHSNIQNIYKDQCTSKSSGPLKRLGMFGISMRMYEDMLSKNLNKQNLTFSKYSLSNHNIQSMTSKQRYQLLLEISDKSIFTYDIYDKLKEWNDPKLMLNYFDYIADSVEMLMKSIQHDKSLLVAILTDTIKNLLNASFVTDPNILRLTQRFSFIVFKYTLPCIDPQHYATHAKDIIHAINTFYINYIKLNPVLYDINYIDMGLNFHQPSHSANHYNFQENRPLNLSSSLLLLLNASHESNKELYYRLTYLAPFVLPLMNSSSTEYLDEKKKYSSEINLFRGYYMKYLLHSYAQTLQYLLAPVLSYKPDLGFSIFGYLQCIFEKYQPIIDKEIPLFLSPKNQTIQDYDKHMQYAMHQTPFLTYLYAIQKIINQNKFHQSKVNWDELFPYIESMGYSPSNVDFLYTKAVINYCEESNYTQAIKLIKTKIFPMFERRVAPFNLRLLTRNSSYDGLLDFYKTPKKISDSLNVDKPKSRPIVISAMLLYMTFTASFDRFVNQKVQFLKSDLNRFSEHPQFVQIPQNKGFGKYNNENRSKPKPVQALEPFANFFNASTNEETAHNITTSDQIQHQINLNDLLAILSYLYHQCNFIPPDLIDRTTKKLKNFPFLQMDQDLDFLSLALKLYPKFSLNKYTDFHYISDPTSFISKESIGWSLNGNELFPYPLLPNISDSNHSPRILGFPIYNSSDPSYDLRNSTFTNEQHILFGYLSEMEKAIISDQDKE